MWFVRLQRLEMTSGGTSSTTISSSHKLEGCLLNLEANVCCLAVDVKLAALLPPTGRGGEGWKRRGELSSSSAGQWFLFLFLLRCCATHTEASFAFVIFGRHGGLFCSFLVEVNRILPNSMSVL